jgi:Tfp pilus assembly protein PilE
MVRRRIAPGFTLSELLVIAVIIGVLVVIAVPAYLSFRGKATVVSGKANVRSAISAAETYSQDPARGNGTYNGISGAELRQVTPGVAATVMAGVNGGKYCIQDTEGGSTFSYEGGAGGAARLTPKPCKASYSVA